MAKCIICKERKGKRFCKITNTLICSICCNENRDPEYCAGCSFFCEIITEKKYRDIPRIALPRMDKDDELQGYANTIESTLCALDAYSPGGIGDKIALRILELLLDRYYFKKETLTFENAQLQAFFSQMENAIKSDLNDVSDSILSQIIATIYFVANRRTHGNREYLDFIHQYVGIRVSRGLRVKKIDDL
jgi:hypothetical protein